jgi:hypothetical protein
VEGAGFRCTAVVELKSPGAPLDRPQPNYGGRTPVDQAFDYAREAYQARWVIVSDMLVIRLYAVESQDEYEVFDLRDCAGEGPSATRNRRRLHLLLHSGQLVKGHGQSPVALLYEKSTARRIEIRAGFYEAYCRIRSDLYSAIATAAAEVHPGMCGSELLQATQRLLDRLMFIYYCEDHPQQLISDETIRRITEAAAVLPGTSTGKVYESLKALFREVDEGSSEASGQAIAAYNGGLFRDHPILDHISLPDSLHRRVYEARGAGQQRRLVQGVYGLHVFDFWTELNEHLLGHIFEQSLSDLGAIAASGVGSSAERWKERRKHGVFYTTDILSDYLARTVLRSTLDDLEALDDASVEATADLLEARAKRLLGLKVADLACGSGAFLVSVHREMVREYRRLTASLAALAAGKADLFSQPDLGRQSAIIRDCVFGADILPQAVEIAQLALWLTSVQKDEKLADLTSHLVSANSLDAPGVFDALGVEPGSLDIVIGNPPWGGTVDADVLARCTQWLGLASGEAWDTWELFLALSIRALREGGRLALLLPDSFFYPAKAKTRKLLLEETTVERVFSLGPDWFGPTVRMGTIAIQARRGPVDRDATIRCMAVSGELRRQAIKGEIQLSQVEAIRSRAVPTRRVLDSPSFEVEVLRGERDDRIISTMEGRSIALQVICDRARGEEMSKSGLAWRCPSCQQLTTPGVKRKGGGYEGKDCPHCGLALTEDAVQCSTAVTDSTPKSEDAVGFIDGDDITTRYRRVQPSKWAVVARMVGSKPDQLYAPPKILIRQAGVGLLATLDETTSRCPQSVYIYRLRPTFAGEGYRHEFVLGALLSRTMNYLVLKLYGETDPAKAYAKLTHARLAALPIPRVDFSDSRQRQAHDTIVADVRRLLDGDAKSGGIEDQRIEMALRGLWGIEAEDGAYINGEFYDLPRGQVFRELFPEGPPLPVSD